MCSALTVTAITLIAVSLQRLESNEFGVAYDVRAKILSSKVEEEGLHAGPPGFKYIKFSSTFSTVYIPKDLGPEEMYNCVSGDGLIVDLEVTFQYLPDLTQLVQLTKLYRNEDRYRRVVRAAGVSAINHGCGDFSISSFQSERAAVQQRMFEYLQLKLEGAAASTANTSASLHPLAPGVFTRAISLSLEDVGLPERYQQAVSAKQSAEEDIALAKNQRQEALTKASTKLRTSAINADVIQLRARESAALLLRDAEFQANATRITFQKEAETYAAIITTLGLTPEGFLAYLGTRAIEETEGAVLSLVEPAPASYRDEL
eukprot:CAMPEP_0114249436 /NCGR_PEP_ID=MMETSP0058-20121206/14142_1 /TAXON_ID=36894 /ORGANISM="Pyramimonas parkeae, CCMP726" /LENGTH=316 /DNA_ID=CAMNT_0001362983 /DNA_START=240 /DNA_END=1193 /DNA_ORIENTATION=+